MQTRVVSTDTQYLTGRPLSAAVRLIQNGPPIDGQKHAIFDEASISVIAFDTVREIERLAGRSLDVRRFARMLS